MMRGNPGKTGLVVVALLAALPARAEGLPPALGRISYGSATEPGEAICTGVLVAPDLVLTAAHCVQEAVAYPQTVRFSAGWSGDATEGTPAGSRQGAEVILLPGTDSPGLGQVLQDVALVVLDRPLPGDAFPPLAIAAPDAGPFTLIGFARSAPDLVPEPALCAPLPAPPGLLALDCPVVSGNSGAPVLQRTGAGWQVVAVMVASARGGTVRSWAVLPPAPFRLRIAEAD